MRKALIIILLILLISGCISYNKSGFILPENESFVNKSTSGGNSYYRAYIPYNSYNYGNIQTNRILKKNTIILQLPDTIEDKDCWRVFGLFVPFYVSNTCVRTAFKDNDNVLIYIYKPYYTEEFINNVQISIKYKNKIYLGQKGIARMSPNYTQFTFPMTIKDIKDSGTAIIIRYKNFYQEVPVNYQLRWYSA